MHISPPSRQYQYGNVSKHLIVTTREFLTTREFATRAKTKAKNNKWMYRSDLFTFWTIS
jgi:hypothetical protein